MGVLILRMSKITNALVLECVDEMRTKPNADKVKQVKEGKLKEAVKKDRKFKESVELQVALKDYDPQKDKRFNATVKLPNIPRENLKICIICDQKHLDEAKAEGYGVEGSSVDVTTLDNLKKVNKKWAKKYYLLLAPDALVKKVPVVLGPILN